MELVEKFSDLKPHTTKLHFGSISKYHRRKCAYSISISPICRLRSASNNSKLFPLSPKTLSFKSFHSSPHLAITYCNCRKFSTFLHISIELSHTQSAQSFGQWAERKPRRGTLGSRKANLFLSCSTEKKLSLCCPGRSTPEVLLGGEKSSKKFRY